MMSEPDKERAEKELESLLNEVENIKKGSEEAIKLFEKENYKRSFLVSSTIRKSIDSKKMNVPTLECKAENPNGLTNMLMDIIDQNLNDRDIFEDVMDWNYSAVVKETSSDESSSIRFGDGEVEIENGEISDPDISIEADFQTLSNVSSGGTFTGLKAMLTGKMKRDGSFSSLLKLQKILST